MKHLIVAAVAAGLLPVTVQAADIRLVTEEYPPFNMIYQGEITGMATDLLKAAFEKAGVTYTLEVLPWARAYNVALTTANTCVYSTTETPERMDKFLWVGPLVDNDWVLLGRADSPAISSLEEARPYKIGGYLGDATAAYLIAEGFRVDTASQDAFNAPKLANGRIDFWATGSQLGPYLANQQGIEGLVSVVTIKQTVMSLACNKDTDPAIIHRLQTALDAVRAN